MNLHDYFSCKLSWDAHKYMLKHRLHERDFTEFNKELNWAWIIWICIWVEGPLYQGSLHCLKWRYKTKMLWIIQNVDSNCYGDMDLCELYFLILRIYVWIAWASRARESGHMCGIWGIKIPSSPIERENVQFNSLVINSLVHIINKESKEWYNKIWLFRAPEPRLAKSAPETKEGGQKLHGWSFYG